MPGLATVPPALDLASVAEASEVLTASVDAEYLLANLLRVAMGRLLATRGVVLLADWEREEGERYAVAAVRGPVALAVGEALTLAAPAEAAEGDAVPPALRAAGLALVVPIRYEGQAAGLLALGPRATGEGHGPGGVAFVRSLAGMAAAALHSARAAKALRDANRDLAGRVQELGALFELAQAFAAAPERRDVLRVLGYALMGQLPAHQYAVLLTDGEGPGEVAAARGLSADALDEAFRTRLLSLGGPLLVDDPQADPEARAALGTRGLALALPLGPAERPRGAVLVGPRATRRPYSPADFPFLGALGSLALAALDRAALVDARVEKELLEEEMRLAREIQERLLPRVHPTVPGLELAVCTQPNRVVAGDYHDLVPLPDGRLVVVVADVAGKGAPAALLMANIQAAVRILAPELVHAADLRAALAEATGRLNRVVSDNTAPGMFITMVWGVWDVGRLVYCNAGHLPPRLVRADGSVEALDAGGALLGVLPDMAYEAGEATLATGDLVMLYTDGLTEAARADGEEYGEDRLDALLVRHRTGSAEAVRDAACTDAEAFAGRTFADDLTILVLKATAA